MQIQFIHDSNALLLISIIEFFFSWTRKNNYFIDKNSHDIETNPQQNLLDLRVMSSDFSSISEEDLKFFIDQFHNQTGKFPKFNELIELIQYTTSSSVGDLKHRISELIDLMVDKGIISWEKKRLRLHSMI